MKAFKTSKINVFWRRIIEMSCVKIFSETSGMWHWTRTCSDRSGSSIAPTPARFGHLHKKILVILKKIPQIIWRTRWPSFSVACLCVSIHTRKKILCPIMVLECLANEFWACSQTCCLTKGNKTCTKTNIFRQIIYSADLINLILFYYFWGA